MAKEKLFGIVKETGKFVADLFGISKFAKSENGQAIQDDVNEIGRTLGLKGAIFQTEKEKQATEKRKQEAVAKAQQQTAQNMAEINKSLQDILKALGGGKTTP